MKTVTYWIKNVTLDAAVAALFIAWKAYGIEGAGNVVLTYFWFRTVLTILAAIVPNTGLIKAMPKRGPLGKTYHSLSTLAEVAALAWFGHYVLTALYALACFAWLAKYERILAQAEAGSPA